MNQELKKLLSDFQPDSLHITLSPFSNGTIDEVENELLCWLKTLKTFMDSGHDEAVGKKLGIKLLKI